MSALVYERKDSYVYTATQLTQQAQRVKNDTAKRNRLLNEAELELNKSEEVIREQVSLLLVYCYSSERYLRIRSVCTGFDLGIQLRRSIRIGNDGRRTFRIDLLHFYFDS